MGAWPKHQLSRTGRTVEPAGAPSEAEWSEQRDRVGLFFPKCVESIISMFAVLKAGGVYVPLDPQAPVDRIGYIISNCGIRVLITLDEKRRTLDVATRESLVRCVIVDEAKESGNGTGVVPWSALPEYPSSHPPAVTLTETDLAYILYTSGSTGGLRA